MAHKILVIEDDRDIRELLDIELRAAGFDTTFARDGVTATTVARKETPDLVVLDLGLPGGDGFIVMDRLKALNSLEHVPVVVVTARTTPQARTRAVAGGAVAFFEKPFDADELIAEVSRILGADA
jgi:DNA-binding response OmpR family regulator